MLDAVFFSSTRTKLMVYSDDVCLLLVLMRVILTCILIRLMQCPNLHTPYILATDSRLVSVGLAYGHIPVW